MGTDWKVAKHDDNGEIVIRDGLNIVANCEVDYWKTGSARQYKSKIMANALQMAASPEMLLILKEELKCLQLWCKAEIPGDVRQGMEISVDKIERAIKRATKKNALGNFGGM